MVVSVVLFSVVDLAPAALALAVTVEAEEAEPAARACVPALRYLISAFLTSKELKKSCKQYSDDMLRVCSGDTAMSFPAKLAAAEDRLNEALTGARRLKPFAEKFYAILNDEQKNVAQGLVDWLSL